MSWTHAQFNFISKEVTYCNWYALIPIKIKYSIRIELEFKYEMFRAIANALPCSHVAWIVPHLDKSVC